MSSAKGLTQKGVPEFPPWLLYLKFGILGLSVLIFALSCYAASLGWGGFMIFVCLKTFIIYGAFLFIELRAPHLYFRIVALILYIFSIIFWLSAWAWSASVAGIWLNYTYGYDFYYGGTNWKTFGAVLAVSAALGAIVWVMSIVHLVFFIKACMASPEGTAVNPHHQAELGNVKAQEAAAPAAAYPPQQYEQQQYAQPQQYPAQHQPQSGYQ